MSTGLGALQGAFGRAALVDLDRPVAPHAHPHAHLVINLSAGPAPFQVGGRELVLDRDTAVLVDPWVPHAFPHPADAANTALLGLYIDPTWLRRLTSEDRGAPAFRAPRLPLTPALRRRIGDVADAVRGPGERAAVGEALITDLFTAMDVLEFRAGPADPLAPSDHRLRRAIGYMRANLSQGFDTAGLAHEAGIARSHFFARFRAGTGLSPGMLTGVLRMEAAYAALSGSRPIGAIARDLGFSRPGHFSRFFRANLGIPPATFRRLLQGQS